MTANNVKNPLPRWRGFNLLEKFKIPEIVKQRHSHSTEFQETDFQWIAAWGFDFVRLPMDYHCWSSSTDWMKIDESVFVDLDHAIELGQRYGIHVCLNLHRAPGYCVNPPLEPRSLWRDADALEACSHHWRTLAKRYVGISSERLSFNLLNEPASPDDNMTLAEHEKVIRALTATIREVDPARLIIADGTHCGNEPSPNLADLGIAQSCRCYLPTGLSFFRLPSFDDGSRPEPTWPGAEHCGERWDRSTLEKHYGNWAQLMKQGIGVHCGEGGCSPKTPHAVFLAWFEDVLDVLKSLGIGYALWNFRGPCGILNTGRTDIAPVDWHGYQLDEKLLKLLQKY